MGYIGTKPSAVPLTSADITDGIITSAKIADGTIVNADINASSAIAISKISATGTANQVLRMNSGATALEYATISTGATAGQVIQVITATDSTARTTTSDTFVTASNTLSVSITPSSASNKIFIIVNSNMRNSTTGFSIFATIFRDSTNLGTSNGLAMSSLTCPEANPLMTTAMAMSILDSPNTTSAITYQVYIRTTNDMTGTIQHNSIKGSITCMEIKG